VDGSGIIVWANRAELEMLGYDRAGFIGHHIGEFYADRECCEDVLARLSRGEELREHEVVMRRKDGELRTVLINSNVLWDGDRFVHTRCFTRDITDRKKNEAALIAAKEEAVRATHVKSEFLAVMSHELRTPLNAIMGYRDLLAQGVGGEMDHTQAAFLDRIGSASSQLVTLIDQILSFSRIEAGAETAEFAEADINEVARTATVLLEPVAASKHLVLEMKPSDADVICETDSGKVSQILLNLLSNAVKFTESGSVRVSVRRENGNACVEIADTGPGISAEDRDRVFEPFVQLDSSSTRRHGGTGLGLAVSRNLANMLGGELRVDSTPGIGSAFTLVLPARSS
jgi:PAS domain S-box-containing protein